MELKEGRNNGSRKMFVGLNCTFMELKAVWKEVIKIGFVGLNCTFMELKELILNNRIS